jgi:hypothetical protein
MRYIDQNELFRATNNGLDVFEHYFPAENLRNPKHYFKERAGEKTPSTRVYWYNGLYLITDYGNQDEVNGMNAVKYVMYREGLQYIDALRYIEEVVVGRKVTSEGFYRPKYAPDYKVRDMKPDDKKGEYKFVYKEKPAETDLAAIGRYVTAEHLETYHGKSVERYDYCGYSNKQNKDVVHTFIATQDYPIFVFDYGTFKKLYKPYDPEKKNRFLYIGEKPKDFIYGLEQIKAAKCEFTEEDENGKDAIKLPEGKPDARVKDLFRCSGESDALNLFSIGCRPYWLNSESADYLPGQFTEVDNLCQNHYQVMDLDATGRKHATKQALQHMNLATIELPEWLMFKKDFRGNPCKDLKDFINISGTDAESTYWNFMALKRKAKTAKFWVKIEDKNGKSSYNISLEHLYWFLQLSGFYRVESIYHKKAGYSYAHIEGKIVKLINPDHIKRIVKHTIKEYVKSKNVMDEITILNKINSSAQISEANLQDLPETTLTFKNYTSTSEVLNFKNLSIKITRDEISKIKHEDLPNYIMGELKLEKQTISHIIDHTFQLVKEPLLEVDPTPEFKILLDKLDKAKTDIERDNANAEISRFPELDKYTLKIRDKDFIFIRFLQDLSHIHWRKELEHKEALTKKEEKEQEQAFINLLYILGYHCSQFKHKAKPWISFLQDMRISEIGQSSGRSGKSLIFTAVEFVRATFHIPGRTLDDKNEFKFIYDGLTEFHDFINVDDFNERGLFDMFYTEATGKRNINPKNLSAHSLSYEDSGKMGITSNFELPKQDSSTVARLLNGGVSDFYHERTKSNNYNETRTPLTRFGRRLYDDFNSHEWNQFYNVIAYAIQLYLRFDKIQPPMENLEKRQARREMASGLGRDEEFFHWANHYFQTCKIGETPEYSDADVGYFNTYIIRENAFENFKQILSDSQKKTYKSNKFKTHLVAFCEYYGYKFNPPELCVGGESEGSRRIMRSIDGKTRECFYISTSPQLPLPPGDNEIENAISNAPASKDADMPF